VGRTYPSKQILGTGRGNHALKHMESRDAALRKGDLNTDLSEGGRWSLYPIAAKHPKRKGGRLEGHPRSGKKKGRLNDLQKGISRSRSKVTRLRLDSQRGVMALGGKIRKRKKGGPKRCQIGEAMGGASKRQSTSRRRKEAEKNKKKRKVLQGVGGVAERRTSPILPLSIGRRGEYAVSHRGERGKGTCGED